MNSQESQMVEFYVHKLEEAMRNQFARSTIGSAEIVNYWQRKLRTARELERAGVPCP